MDSTIPADLIELKTRPAAWRAIRRAGSSTCRLGTVPHLITVSTSLRLNSSLDCKVEELQRIWLIPLPS